MTEANAELAALDVQEEEEELVNRSQLLYGLTDRPPVVEAIFVAFQHVLAAFVGIITPPIIICSSLGLDAANTSYLISMSLFASGLCTFIQCKKIGPVGSGLLSLQGTSFAFLGPILGVGSIALQGGKTPEQALALIFGVCFFGSFVEIILSRFLHLMNKIITPVVSGTVVMIIGLGLIKTGVTSLAGGAAALAKNDGSFGSWQNLALGGTVLLIVVLLTLSKNRFLRMGAIAIGLAVGYIASLFMGIVNFSGLSALPLFSLPIPFRYGMSFDWGAFLPFILLYVLTAIETVGDLTATSAVSGEPVKGSLYIRRIKGGVLGDGVNSLIAAVLNTFPNTTFSQNNGVIQMTGVGSRYVGFYVAAIFSLLGLVPIVGGVFQAIPQPVLGGATLVMFGSIAVAGLNIVTSVELDRRSMIIVAVSLGLGLGVVFMPQIFANKPPLFSNLFGSAISTGGLTAILLSALLPRELPSSTSSKAERLAEVE
ncbi:MULTISPECIES: uracil-xanthine permease family protein [Leptolyngbya]|uniref:Nucleobase:cation symporter-2 family protein n=1 Tax=Leptolyngbya boryana CZ1 TaxID=3060204 RepID=A0AA97AUK7_LEPBY|nr:MULTISPECIES: nucleobase:cation symporter-2 family protein [Leptolyngbya]MCY6492273.1 nucleobase:cation symporter-2 family protein [Leptolyngbya sp. GGD]WNZ44396.1 nucleobase:cation symporter-2 family protein [Leptolyngbya boryana CZ1]